ncbi:MAG TPA: S-methyl-5-thioribose-1-phosphate isomerase [Candidatus Norongarragalinales archaeon]|jgi:methylthioribose-1-phosphate isomerase|nr:S-methyl-5-thioribose-1-phosphate isomerase [Candidatus Norongarragalinales archaeon]
MIANGKHYRTVWMEGKSVFMIEQTLLPFEFKIHECKNHLETCSAIKQMIVRGAGAIGATAAFAMAQAFLEYPGENSEEYVTEAKGRIERTRPTAQNLFYATKRVYETALKSKSPKEAAVREANAIADEDAEFSKSIGQHGLAIIEEIAARKQGQPVNILTHCNAGWLAFVDYGTATAPMYLAQEKKIPLHVWVDETRPRNQGASLTAWELLQARVPHHVIVDNSGGHLMQHGKVDMVIVGCDRVTRNGDVANKIGTYLKALSAKDNNVPFYVACPSSTIDWSMKSGREITIEERDPSEVIFVHGISEGGKIGKVRITPEGSPAVNHGFDVTPARLITGLITERGVCEASEQSLLELFPEKRD